MNKMKSLFQSFVPIALALLLVATNSLPTFAAQPLAKERPPETEIVVTPTDTWAVEVLPGSDPDQLALSMGAENLGQIGSLENIYLFRIPGSEEVSAAAETFAADSGVVWFEQQVARQRVTRAPTDPLYGSQWHLPKANVPAVWTAGYTGSGVNIAIVDDGLQHTHPDLSPNYRPSLSRDFVDSDNDPAPSTGDGHGTSVAGVAAARDDGVACGVGVAYRAGLSGLRLITGAGTTDAQEASALQYEFAGNHIYNNSWGPIDNGSLDGPGLLTQQALLNAVTNGRGGKGSIFVWAAGNGLGVKDNVNYDGYANSRFTIAVGAVDNNGVQASYSEPGAAMLVTAPSSGNSLGITTTDLLGADGYSAGNCTGVFGGTSASSPLAAGVVALMLEANPNLGWRDVQHILVKTAVKNDPTDADWTTNGAGYPINHKYGFGLVDAQAAVNHALTWTNVGLPTSLSRTKNVNQNIPDNNLTGISSTIDVAENFIVEHVEVVFNATHTWRGDLRIVLTSPSGTQSVLAAPRADGTQNYSSWKFMTVRNWNETTAGNWTLRVADEDALATGQFNSWQLILHGQKDSTTARVVVSIDDDQKGEYFLSNTQSIIDKYSMTDGPVIVQNTNGFPIIASLRAVYSPDGGTSWTSYAEMVGLPVEQVTDSYLFPWYNNLHIRTNIKIANIDTRDAVITVKIAGTVMGTYNIPSNGVLDLSYPDINAGPVNVKSLDGVKFVVSEYISFPQDGSTWTSYYELIGFPETQLTDHYVFPWYNSVHISTQMSFANVGATTTDIVVKIGGVIRGTYTLAPNQSRRLKFFDINNGPVEVYSTNGVPIISSQRVAYSPDNGLTWPSYTELMGLPLDKLSDTYYFPWYNTVNQSMQVSFANVGTSSTTVTVTIAGNVQGSYVLSPNQSRRVKFFGVNEGMVKVHSSNGVPIIVSERAAYSPDDGVTWTRFAEMLGLPENQMSHAYVFPYYDDINIDSAIMIGYP